MADEKSNQAKSASKPDDQQTGTTKASGELGTDELQKRFDEANEKGYFGETASLVPNENYTLKGVTSGAPTPENAQGRAEGLHLKARQQHEV